jgi:Undecaprenyl-phosphate glucose phosphotransferase
MISKPVVRPMFVAMVAGADAFLLISLGLFVLWGSTSFDVVEPISAIAGVVGLSLVTCIVLANSGSYRFDRLASLVRQIGTVVTSVTFVALGLLLSVFLLKADFDPPRGWFVFAYFGAITVLTLGRAIAARKIAKLRRAGRAQTTIALVGANETAVELIKYISDQQLSEYLILGVYDDRSLRGQLVSEDLAIAGNVDDLKELGRSRIIDQIIVTLPPSGERRILELLERVKDIAASVHLAPSASELHFMFRRISHIGGFPIFHVFDRPLSDRDIVFKRIEDLVIGAAALALLSPVFLVLAALVKLTSPGPILFRQRRFGLNNQSFDIFKFRTMYNHAPGQDGTIQARAHDPRITSIGGVLRRLSLDELPQLLNVMRGDMSLVGPRPHPIQMKAGDQQYEAVVADYASRHRMKPGMTGWAQINGWRGETTSLEHARKRIEFDLYYIANWSIGFDLKILAMTLPAVIAGRGAV